MVSQKVYSFCDILSSIFITVNVLSVQSVGIFCQKNYILFLTDCRKKCIYFATILGGNLVRSSEICGKRYLVK